MGGGSDYSRLFLYYPLASTWGKLVNFAFLFILYYSLPRCEPVGEEGDGMGKKPVERLFLREVTLQKKML